MQYKYRQSVADELARHGVIPGADTPPELIHEFVNELYLIEIRSLKRRMLAGEILKADYSTRVEELRSRYPILSLPVHFWIETQ
jgi:hypothetical protein